MNITFIFVFVVIKNSLKKKKKHTRLGAAKMARGWSTYLE